MSKAGSADSCCLACVDRESFLNSFSGSSSSSTVSYSGAGGPEGAKDCGMDPYAIVHDLSKFVDQQVIKLQEAPDMVPVGELPRHLTLTADRFV